ncbi:MAG: Threonine dehydratase, catabolic [Hydrogenibacillus schlegelii]|uniref:threonine ammonia-lyase n=1 Tax=Hydrogenibacillus schlegelii TaxID=1484 RepID=A0A2T5GCR7_HYDSH|nr:threonine/serine dehydratase [Hydrogenibacillus schlegelii]PTQ53979.1 MAG: Threonine dehydratase, catabolic [Hydrogenibacillus schlegelii]
MEAKTTVPAGAPTAADVLAADARLRPHVHRTPLLRSAFLDGRAGASLFLKGEHLQKTGSFKIRGALNAVLAAAEAGARAVVAASSGNHGAAVAYAARAVGLPATVVVPASIAPAKRAAIEAYGGRIVVAGDDSETRLSKARELAAAEGAAFIPPYDDPRVIAGQGTVGLEVLDDLPDVEAIYVPIGGGGLISGIATWVKDRRPEVAVIGVEPELADDTHGSLAAGRRVALKAAPTIADGLRALTPGELTFPIIARLVDDVVRVSETEIVEAVFFLMTRLKQVVEPSGAVSVAAALRPAAARRRVAILSGGNVDWRALWPALSETLARHGL